MKNDTCIIRLYAFITIVFVIITAILFVRLENAQHYIDSLEHRNAVQYDSIKTQRLIIDCYSNSDVDENY